MHPIAVAESRAQQVRHRKVHKIHLEKSFWSNKAPPVACFGPGYLLVSFTGGFVAAACAGRKLARGGTGLLPPFGFFASRLRLPRPFDMGILLIARWLTAGIVSAAPMLLQTPKSIRSSLATATTDPGAIRYSRT